LLGAESIVDDIIALRSLWPFCMRLEIKSSDSLIGGLSVGADLSSSICKGDNYLLLDFHGHTESSDIKETSSCWLRAELIVKNCVQR